MKDLKENQKHSIINLIQFKNNQIQILQVLEKKVLIFIKIKMNKIILKMNIHKMIIINFKILNIDVQAKLQ